MTSGAKIRRKSCFVVGPIGHAETEVRTHADWLYYEIIRRVVDSFSEYDTIRADEISAPGMIDGQVVRHLIDDDLVIADLSFLNPNAFYEIGIRHVMKKPIIHMQRKSDVLPFDVNQFRAIKFAMATPQELNEARAELRKSIEAVHAPNYSVDNPYVRAGAVANLMATAPESDRFLLGEIEKLRTAVTELQQESSPKARLAPQRSDKPALSLSPRSSATIASLPAYLEIRPTDNSNDVSMEELGPRLVALTYQETSFYARYSIDGGRLLLGIGGIKRDNAVAALASATKLASSLGFSCTLQLAESQPKG